MVANKPIWDLKNTSLIIVGAGFSRAATDDQTPLMFDFFDRLSHARYPKLYDFIVDVAGAVQTANAEQVLRKLDQIKSSPRKALVGWGEQYYDDEPTMRREFCSYTLDRIGTGFDIDSDNWAANVLFGCPQQTTVISMNYDNLAEVVLSQRPNTAHCGSWPVNCSHCKMRMLLEKVCNCGLRSEDVSKADWQGTLLKPHGSIAWSRCQNPDCCSVGCLVADPRCQPFTACCCTQCGSERLPVLVMPTMAKNLNEIPEIAVMWRAASQAVANAESILVFGFSMPESDELLAIMIRSQICKHRKLKRIGVIDLSPAAVMERLTKCLPDDSNIERVLLPVEKRTVPEWSEAMISH